MQRRDFLKNSALASTALFAPAFLQAYSPKQRYSSRSGRILVVVQLSGGNDGLNTIVPYRNDAYYQNRPQLSIRPEAVLKVSDSLGFNPALQSLQGLYDTGLMTIVNDVGYPNPDRSHFRSMDIWHTASGSDEYLSTGWIGRYLDNACRGCDRPYHALELDDGLSLALKGAERNGFAISDPNQLKRTTDNRLLQAIAKQAHQGANEQVAYLYKTMIDTQSSADYLHQQSRVYRSKISYPPTPFGRDLQLVAELITADTDTGIYYLSLSGFDTHANQRNQQERLLKQYADGMKAFVEDLQQNNILHDTLILTFSEFGRRVKQNASGGTDHGTANNLFLLGGNLKQKGFYNDGPDLTQLDNGDLRYRVDFRNIYAEVLEHWLEVDAGKVLSQRFERLNLV